MGRWRRAAEGVLIVHAHLRNAIDKPFDRQLIQTVEVSGYRIAHDEPAVTACGTSLSGRSCFGLVVSALLSATTFPIVAELNTFAVDRMLHTSRSRELPQP